MVSSLGACITESTPRVSPIMKNISVKISSEEALILCGNNKPVSFHHKYGTSQPLMGVTKSTSALWFRRGYQPCQGFDFQAVSIAFFPFSRAFFMFFISPSNSVSRSKSISHANSLASFTTECEPFSFSCFKASSRIQLSHKFKYQKRPFADVL